MGLGFGLAGVVISGMVLTQAWSWWSARSYVPVQAMMQDVELNMYGTNGRSRSGMSGRSYITTASYSYEFAGQRYTVIEKNPGGGGDNIGMVQRTRFFSLSGAREAGATVTAWVDPAQPQTATLNREFRWGVMLILLPLSLMATAIGLACFIAPPFRQPAAAMGTLIAADHGNYLFVGMVALWWNSIALVLALVAMAETVHGVRFVHLAALALFAVGIVLAAKAWRMYEASWLLGSPVLAWLDYSSGRFKARIHFHPALGVRLHSGSPSYPVGIVVKQLEEVRTLGHSGFRAVWSADLGQIDVPHGASAIDIESRAPALRGADDPMASACWQVTVHALGSSAVFHLKP